jgi:hypothetical protein
VIKTSERTAEPQRPQRKLSFSFPLRGLKAKNLKPLRAVAIDPELSKETDMVPLLAASLLIGFPLPPSQRQREK